MVPSEFEGAVVSPEFPTLTLDESQLVPGFMGFVCQQRSFHYEMKSRSTGTAERRNRLKPSDLLEIEIGVPPLLEQQRIANTAAVATSLSRQADTADVLAEALRDQLLGMRRRPRETSALPLRRTARCSGLDRLLVDDARFRQQSRGERGAG